MRVLMFGWEFPPHIAGGLGTACYGMTRGLARNDVEVIFVMPRASGDEDERFVKVVNASDVEARYCDSNAEGAAEFGMAAPMGARMMSGQTKYHEQLERELADFVGKEDAFLLNFGYQGMISIIDCLLTPRDVVVYDAECHACIIDGLRMHKGKRFVYAHNNEESLRLQLKHATDLAEAQRGGVLVITEGVFGMKGDLGFPDVIVKAKQDFNFRFLVDDAHGFGTMGSGGKGTAAHFGCVDGIDVLFNTFAKSMAGIGAFVCGPRWLINLFRYNMRSQLYAKSLPMVIGALKRLDLIRNHPEYQEKLWEITRAIQSGFKNNGFDIGVTQSPVTPVYMKGGEQEGTNLIVDLRENYSIFCSIVIYPVIPKGEIILRIIPTAAHTLEDVERTIEAFKAVREKFDAGYYASIPIPMKADPEFKVR